MSVLSWIGKAFSNATKWLAKAFTSLKVDAAKLAVVITEELKPFLVGKTGITVAAIIDGILGSHVADNVRLLAIAEINKVLAAELLLEGLPDNATPEQMELFAESVVKAFTNIDVKGKAKLYSTLTAQVLGVVEEFANENVDLTFAKLIDMGEIAYQDYQTDLAAEAA